MASALAFAAGMALAVALCDAAAAKPSRIVSLNVCTDQVLLDLVPRERIAAVSHLAADPSVSAVAEKAHGLPSTRGEAEIVVAFDADLVLAGEYSTPATVALLERIGRNVVKVPLASDIEGIAATVRKIASAVGEEAKGEAVLADAERRIASAAPRADETRPTALVYQVNGLASGPGSLADVVLTAAGFVNKASSLKLGGGGALALEVLVADPPDVLVLSGPADEYRTVVAENLRHPALRAIGKRHATVVVPWRLWLCATPYVASAVEELAAARRALAVRTPSQ